MTIAKKLFISFISGSSLPSFIILFIVVITLFKRKEAKFNYFTYSITAPLGLGIIAMLAKFCSIYFHTSLEYTYFIVSMFSALFVCINISSGAKAYNFKNKNRWYMQYLMVFLGHLFIYNIIIYNIDLSLSS